MPLRDIIHPLLQRKPSERFATAVDLDAVLRARLAKLGPYLGEDAVKEVQRALVGAGDRLWDLEVPDDEGGITAPMGSALSQDESSTKTEPTMNVRTVAPPMRHPDEVTTVSGGGPDHAINGRLAPSDA